MLGTTASPSGSARGIGDYAAATHDQLLFQNESVLRWRSFIFKFRRALHRHDREALRNMMAPNFWSWPAQMTGRDVAFQTWDDPYKNGWRAFERTLRRRSVWMSNWYRNAAEPWRPMRIVPREANMSGNPGAPVVPWYAIFRYEADGHWYCTVFSGCCE